MLKLDDLNPDGVKIVVNWSNMSCGHSVFILCINTEKAIAQLAKILDRKGWQCTVKVVVEGGRLGVRVWRMV